MATESHTGQVAQAIGDANKGQISQALIIQAYANSVNQQPNVDFSGEETLKEYETEINDGLKTAQSHANLYLNEIQPAILKNIASIGNYYALHDAVATSLPEGSTEDLWIISLNALMTESQNYQKAAQEIVTTLQSLNTSLNADSAGFAKVVSKLNAAVEGDNGVLDSMGDQLDTIQGQIDGAIAGTALSALAIVGGAFLICVGAITGFVTAGASTPMVVAGVAILAVGIGGEVASALTLKSLNDEKAGLLTDEANLKAEVKLALGISKGYVSLKNQVNRAVTAATSMANAWTSLSADLGALIKDLQLGVKNVEIVRTIFLTAANTVIKTILTDINTIKQQMSGATQIVAKEDQTVGEAAVAAAEGKEMRMNVESTKSFQSDAPSRTLSHKMVSFKSFRTGAPSGNLSQSLANLNSTVSRVRAISNLPTAAVVIQRETLSGASSIVSRIKSLQGSVGGYVTSALPQLNTIEIMITKNEPVNKIKAAIHSLRNETGYLNTHSQQALSAIRNTVSIMNCYFNQLSSIQSAITSQKTQLEAQLLNAESQAEAAKKNYYWLIALGPFGLIGLAAALGVYLKIKSEVDGYQSQIDSLNSHISSLDSVSTATGDLSTNIGDVVSKVSSVNNAVTFVANDILNIEADLKPGQPLIIVGIFVKAAITEVNTLKVDAS